jgi:uncharacterized protein
MVEFEWDENKARKVFESRKIDFDDVALMFDVNHIKIRTDYSKEERWLVIGEIDGKCVTGVYTHRSNSIRIITARRARKNEEREYYSQIHG